MSVNVGIVIPAYSCGSKLVKLCNELAEVIEKLDQQFRVLVIIVDDACPDESWRNVSRFPSVQILHNYVNRGVGASVVRGFQYALDRDCHVLIKMDSDGQHRPTYIPEIIYRLSSAPSQQLFLMKGSRYALLPNGVSQAPWFRRMSSFILEPLARVALSRRNLTDIGNGFLGFNQFTAKYLMSSRLGVKIQSRFLFESSVLEKCSMLRSKIIEFPMLPNYGPDWSSTFNSTDYIIPFLVYWFRCFLRRIQRTYLFSLNLGSLFLILGISSLLGLILLCFQVIFPSIISGVFVSSGNAALFIVGMLLFIASLVLFLLYDYLAADGVEFEVTSAYLEELSRQ